MRYMVRRIVGTLVDVGRGALTEEDVRMLLGDCPLVAEGKAGREAKSGTVPYEVGEKGTIPLEAGAPIHACGLTLEKVVYPALTSRGVAPIIDAADDED